MDATWWHGRRVIIFNGVIHGYLGCGMEYILTINIFVVMRVGGGVYNIWNRGCIILLSQCLLVVMMVIWAAAGHIVIAAMMLGMPAAEVHVMIIRGWVYWAVF